MNASEFWAELPHVLSEAEHLEDAEAAAMLVNFLEDYRHMWPNIAASMRASAARRALFERSVLILAERDGVDDGIPN